MNMIVNEWLENLHDGLIVVIPFDYGVSQITFIWIFRMDLFQELVKGFEKEMLSIKDFV